MRRFNFILIIAYFLSASVSAQICNTLYFMDKVPEYTQLNPAFQPKCNFFLGIANINTNFGFNSLSLNDVLYYDNQLDSLITIMHPNASKDKFINNLKSTNNIFINNQVDPITLGVRIKDIQFTLGLSVKSDVTGSYPRDFARMVVTGLLDSVASYDFRNFGINSLNYAELSFCVAKSINELWNVGVRAKLLSGIFNVSTKNEKFSLNSSIERLTADSGAFRKDISTDLNIIASLPYFNVKTDSINQLDNLDLRDNPNKYYKPFNNTGIGFDFGATYSGINNFLFSASLLDIGYIKWKKDVYKFSMRGDTSFIGVGNIDFINQNDSDITSRFVDSFTNVFKFDVSKTKITTWLPAKLLLGAEYMPVQFFSLGLLSVSEYFRQQFYQQFTLSGNLRLFRMFMLSTSYSIFENGFSNMGVGLSFRISDPIIYLIPINIYLIADNIPLRYSKGNIFNGDIPIPYKARNFSLRFGLNFVFGAGAQQKKRTDRPLIVD